MKTKKILNLPMDLAEEVLCRIPLTSLRKVRSTCKKWNTLSKGKSFANKSLKKTKSLVNMNVMMFDFRVNLVTINLDGGGLSLNRQAKLVSNVVLDQVHVTRVFHCDGLLLCINDADPARLVVWNPYWCQTRFIDTPPNPLTRGMYSYSMGYQEDSLENKKKKHYKILRLIFLFNFVEFKIYHLTSNTWTTVLDDDDDVATQDWVIDAYYRPISLKGNTFFITREPDSETGAYGYLVCFDFTADRFGPRLPLPFEWFDEDTVCFSTVREEQLVVLFQRGDTSKLEIWVTSKIEPNAVSWNSNVFLSVDMRPYAGYNFLFAPGSASFFIDEEKKAVVVFGEPKKFVRIPRNVAYMIGVDGSIKETDFGLSDDPYYKPVVYSYVPSLVQL